jgi:RNA polymerase sigma-70 factor, ECF subfamily
VAASPDPGLWMEAGQEAGLLLSAQQGDCDAFLELVAHYRFPLYRLAYALTRNENDARVLARDAFVLAWKNLKSLPVSRPIYPWLVRTVRNLSSNFRKRRTDGRGLGHASASPRERATVMAYAELGIDDQVILALRLIQHLTYEDLSTVLEVPTRTAMSRLTTAREQVRSRAAKLPGGA